MSVSSTTLRQNDFSACDLSKMSNVVRDLRAEKSAQIDGCCYRSQDSDDFQCFSERLNLEIKRLRRMEEGHRYHIAFSEAVSGGQ